MIDAHKGGKPKAAASAVAAWKKHRPLAVRPLAFHLGISQPAVSKWPQVPAERLEAVAHFLRVPPESLRPDLFDPFASLNPKGN